MAQKGKVQYGPEGVQLLYIWHVQLLHIGPDHNSADMKCKVQYRPKEGHLFHIGPVTQLGRYEV